MKQAYTAHELAQLLGVGRTAVVHRARREGWKKTRRGKQRPYITSSLPSDVMDRIAEAELAGSQPAILEEGNPAKQDDRQTVHVSRRQNPAQLKDWQREIRDARLAILSVVQEMAHAYGGITKAERALAKYSSDPNATMSPELVRTLRTANARRGNSCHVGSSTLRLWRKTRDQCGPDALAPAPMERKKEEEQPSWLQPFVKLYCRPTKPSISQAYEQLRKQGYKLPSKRTVERTVQSMPPLQAAKGRMGPRDIKSIKAYVKRTTDELRPGDVYTADGHKADFEVQHPEHGQAVRPEIISVLDVKTRKCVGFSVELHERAWLVADALRVSCQWNGIPAIFYVDNGCGFKNELMTGPGFGVLNRLGVTVKHSLPYGSQARGVIERFNHSCWVRAAKELPSYIGQDMDQDAQQRVHKKTRKELAETGSTKWMPSWEQMLAWAMERVMDYNSRPHTDLPMITDQQTGERRHMTPDESWERLADESDIVRPTQLELDDMFRPYVVRKTSRCLVRVYNGEYYAKELQDHHGSEVRVGIDIFDPRWVWVRDLEGRLITTAELDAHARPYFHPSVVEQAREKRAREQQKRLQRKEAKVLELAEQKKENGEPAPEAEQPSADQLQAQRELEAELQQEQEKPSREETPLERFKRAKRLEDRLADGETVSEEDARWLRGYQRTSEYGGYQDMFEDFGEAIFG